jgi:hypothetical protein
MEVRIPPGVDDGSRIRLSGEGDAGPKGGPRGDLYIFISVTPHELFERDGRVCRHFTLLREADGRRVSKQASACRYGEGDWRMING